MGVKDTIVIENQDNEVHLFGPFVVAPPHHGPQAIQSAARVPGRLHVPREPGNEAGRQAGSVGFLEQTVRGVFLIPVELKAGQSLLLNNRRWQLRQVHAGEGHSLELEAVGASEASLGMVRQLAASLYGDDLFIARPRRQGYWHGHLRHDWLEDPPWPGAKLPPGYPARCVGCSYPPPGRRRF